VKYKEGNVRAAIYVLVLCSLGKEGDRKISLIWKAFEFSPRNLDRQRFLGRTSDVDWFEGCVTGFGRGDLWKSVLFQTKGWKIIWNLVK
jgi:hypothetical protein